jgi:hypothetical protein
MDFEDYLAREKSAAAESDPTAPPIAGGG